MKILTMPQRSPEWYEARRGVFTSSEFGMFLVNTGKVAENARQNLIDQKLGEAADGEDCPPNYADYWMKRGTMLETAARDAFQQHVGFLMDEVGFILHDNGRIGCSPDGALARGGFVETGLEMKCPSGKIQVKRLREGVLPDEYRCQVHGCMVVTGADEWHFWSWHPNLPPLHVWVKRDDFTEQLAAGLHSIAEEYRRQEIALAALWRAAFEQKGAA